MQPVRTEHGGGCHCARTGLLLDGRFLGTRGWNSRNGEKRMMDKAPGSYTEIKSHTAAISSIFATDLNKRRLGAIRSKAHPASAPFTVLSPHLLRAIISRSLLPLGLSRSGRHAPAVMGTPSTAGDPGDGKLVCLHKQGVREGKGKKKSLSLC